MNIESFRDFCLSLPFTGEKTPFDTVTLVFTVKDKMFALTNLERFESINLKCDPEKAIELRETFSAIIPGWHMHKKHCNKCRNAMNLTTFLFIVYFVLLLIANFLL